MLLCSGLERLGLERYTAAAEVAAEEEEVASSLPPVSLICSHLGFAVKLPLVVLITTKGVLAGR